MMHKGQRPIGSTDIGILTQLYGFIDKELNIAREILPVVHGTGHARVVGEIEALEMVRKQAKRIEDANDG